MKPSWEDDYEIPAEIDFSKKKRIKNPFVQEFRELNLVSLGCLVPQIDGAYFSEGQKEALWDRYFTGAPVRLRQSVERYNIVKRA